jgi:hypothetical protein
MPVPHRHSVLRIVRFVSSTGGSGPEAVEVAADTNFLTHRRLNDGSGVTAAGHRIVGDGADLG